MIVLKNTMWLTVSVIVAKMISLWTIVMIARRLGVEQFGVYSLIFTIIGFIVVFANYGFDPLMIREIARNPLNINMYISNNIFLKFIFSSFSLIALIIIGIMKSTLLLPLCILGLSFLFYNPLMTISASFYGIEKMKWSSLIQVIGESVKLIVILYFLYAFDGLMSIVTAYAIANLISCAILITIAKYKINLKFKIETARLKETIKEAFPFALNALVFMVYFRCDIIILSWLKGGLSVGAYSASYRIIDAFLFLPASIMGAVYPSFSRKHGASDSEFWFSFDKIIKYLAMIGIPIGFSITILASKIIELIYGGQQWALSITYLKVLIWTVTLIFLNCSFPVALNARGKQKISAIVLLAGTAVNILFNILMIPFLDALGACISTVITEAITTIIYLYIFRKDYSISKLSCNIYKPILASCIMTLVIFLLYKFNLVIIIIAGIFVYGLSFLVIKGFDSDDYGVLFPYLRKREC